MSTHNSPNSGHEPEEVDASKGYEPRDVRVSGIVVFLVALGVFAVVTGLLAYGVGKVIDARMASEDGPKNKWTRSADVRPLGNFPSSPELQNKLAEMTQHFPAPRLQTDDGNQDVADLHAREDLLLNHYSWVDQSQSQSQSKVRIPIERAMELLAQRGLPVAPAAGRSLLMTGDKTPAIAMPLTNGFARTGYELDQAAAQAIESHRSEERK
ncbi:MAG: hypothetical protein ABSF70_18705 [Terracidiphilus sp.]|jgi:hypothetical protein